MNDFYRVIPYKVSTFDEDRFDRDLTKDELFVSISSMKNEKPLGIYGLLFEFYKAMWDAIRDDFNHMAIK